MRNIEATTNKESLIRRLFDSIRIQITEPYYIWRDMRDPHFKKFEDPNYSLTDLLDEVGTDGFPQEWLDDLGYKPKKISKEAL